MTPHLSGEAAGARALNIVLVGGEAAGVQALNTISRAGHRLVAVLAAPSRGAGVSRAAEKLEIRLWPARLVKEPGFADTIRANGVDLLLNVHSLYIICAEVLQAPRIGSFNLHPGLLPRYAGLNAPSWALYRGEQRHGVTLHWMVPEIDAGPVAHQSEFAIAAEDTGLSLALKCVRAGVPLVAELLGAAAVDPTAIPRIDQDLSRREYFGPDPPDQGCVNWNRPARAVANFVRACDYRPFPSPWGHPRTAIDGTTVGIVAVERTNRSADEAPGTIGQVGEDGAEIACADEWLRVTHITRGGRFMRIAELFRTGAGGRRSEPG